MIMVLAAVLPGQTGRNGHARAGRGGAGRARRRGPGAEARGAYRN